MTSKAITAVVCAGAVACLSACGGGSGGGQASIRLVNATSSYPSLDLYEAATSVNTGVTSYSAGSYAGLGTGTYNLNLEATGAGAILSSSSQTVTAGDHYAAVAYVNAGALQTALIGEDQAIPAAGIASVRFWDTAYANVGTVDAYVVTTACSALASTSASPAVSGLTTTTSFVSVAASTTGTPYHICVTGSGNKSDLRLDIPSVTLTSQQVTTFVLTNTAGGVLLNGLQLDQQGTATADLNTSARVRLAVGATGGAPVTATVDNTALGTSQVAPSVGGYTLVTAGKLTTAISVNGVPLPDPGFTANAGSDLTLLVNGNATSTPTFLADDNSVSSSAAAPVKIRLVNGLNGTTGSSTLTDDYISVGAGAGSPGASTYLQVPASNGLGRIEADYGGTQLCLSTGVTLQSGHVYSVFVLGDLPTAASVCNIRLDQ